MNKPYLVQRGKFREVQESSIGSGSPAARMNMERDTRGKVK